jgi:hypothetical protein
LTPYYPPNKLTIIANRCAFWTQISQEEFLAFFARAVFNLDNVEFDKMCTEMLDDEPN